MNLNSFYWRINRISADEEVQNDIILSNLPSDRIILISEKSTYTKKLLLMFKSVRAQEGAINHPMTPEDLIIVGRPSLGVVLREAILSKGVIASYNNFI